MLKRIRSLFRKKSADALRTEAASEPGALERPPIHRGPQVVHRPIPIEDLDPDAVKIVRRLTRFDHTAYLVGGCVRDLLLERKPKDYDIGTSATPRQVKRLFRNCRIIGKRFRLAHIYFQNGKVIEVATFRSLDLDSADNGNGGDLLIREDNVFGTPEEDALRRDFTINALFYDVNDETVLDHADGLGDLRRRYIRAIGDPDLRFREDPIRILRAIKFAARLDFEIEEETHRALLEHRDEIPKAAAPRVLEEIHRFCRGGAARASFDLLRKTGVFGVILPEFEPGYRDDATAWNRALVLMEMLDRRQAKGHEPTGGEIVTALMLPLVAQRLGWRDDGTAEQARGLDVRAIADEYLRPMAARLRLSRKDQERSRQILMTLFRMVPARRVRRSTRQSILRRECLSDALWILRTVAEGLGGEFKEALDYWTPAAAERGPRGDAQAAEAGRGRRGGRRRSRRRSRRSEPAAEAPPPKREGSPPPKREGSPPPKRDDPTPSKRDDPTPSKRDDLPPPWDDRYFFAALPTVPKLEEDGGRADRYGAAAVAGRADEQQQAEAEESAPPSRSRRRRRRGRGRGRRRGADASAGGANDADASAGGANDADASAAGSNDAGPSAGGSNDAAVPNDGGDDTGAGPDHRRRPSNPVEEDAE